MKSQAKLVAFPYVLWVLFFTVIPFLLVIFYAATSKDNGALTLDNIANASKYFPVL